MNDEQDLRAAEFALGLLPADEARQVEAESAADGPLAARIAWWREQFDPLHGAETALPTDLWPAIARQLPAPAVNDNRPGFWRPLAITMSGVAATLLLYIGTGPKPEPVVVTRPAPAPLVAVLAGAGGTQVAVAVAPGEGALTVAPQKLDPGAGDAELWVIPGDGRARSLGVIAAAGRTRNEVSAALRPYLREGVTFAISLEPKGGSPTGSATGPIVATGQLFSG